jgi:GNAT superfamily N-acetyltransferase
MECGDAIYLHRIVVNPLFKGRRLFGTVLEWATRCAHGQGLSFIRMDTWANNPRIIDYYRSFGFHFVEFYTTPDSPALPSHNRNLGLALLEMKVRTDNQRNT